MGLFNILSGKGAQIIVNDADVSALYADFMSVTVTHEVLILDFGLLSQSPGSSQPKAKVLQRLAMNFYVAKLFLATLQMTIQRHEEEFGAIRRQAVGLPDERAIGVEAEEAYPAYANFVRVTGTPEEVIFDFGVNPQPFGAPREVRVSHRLITSFYTAKGLMEQVRSAIQRQETQFGEIETDRRRRARVDRR